MIYLSIVTSDLFSFYRFCVVVDVQHDSELSDPDSDCSASDNNGAPDTSTVRKFFVSGHLLPSRGTTDAPFNFPILDRDSITCNPTWEKIVVDAFDIIEMAVIAFDASLKSYVVIDHLKW